MLALGGQNGNTGSLGVGNILPVWQSEVLGFIEKHWGDSSRRFEAVVIVGGGAGILHDPLLRRFGGRAFVPDDPVISTARGMFKFSLMRSRRT